MKQGNLKSFAVKAGSALGLSAALAFSNSAKADEQDVHGAIAASQNFSPTATAPLLREELNEGYIPAPDFTDEAWVQADEYALHNPVVAIALYGPKDHPDLEKAKTMLESWFAQRNTPTKTFIGENHAGGFSVGFYVKGVAYGPTAVNKDAIPNMERAAYVLPGAWPQQDLPEPLITAR